MSFLLLLNWLLLLSCSISCFVVDVVVVVVIVW